VHRDIRVLHSGTCFLSTPKYIDMLCVYMQVQLAATVTDKLYISNTHTAIYYARRIGPATHVNTLQHTATHCNTQIRFAATVTDRPGGLAALVTIIRYLSVFHNSTHTYIHKYIHTYKHTYRQTDRHTDRHTCMQTCIHACIHTCMHAHKVYIMHKNMQTSVWFIALVTIVS